MLRGASARPELWMAVFGGYVFSHVRFGSNGLYLPTSSTSHFQSLLLGDNGPDGREMRGYRGDKRLFSVFFPPTHG